MSKMKKISAIISSAVIIMSASVTNVSAENMTALTSDEKAQVKSAIDYESSMTKRNFKYDIADAYKVYNLDFDWVERCASGADFKSLIGETYEGIVIPVYGKSICFEENMGILMTVRKKNGVYRVIAQTDGAVCFDYNAAVKKIVNSIDEEVVNVIHATVEYWDIIYIETKDNQYIVPYMFASKWAYGKAHNKVTSGKMYELSEFMDIMLKCSGNNDSDAPAADTNYINDMTSYMNDNKIEADISGDINKNGKTDIYDVIEIARYLIGLRTFTANEFETADVNSDGKIDIYDAVEASKLLISK